MGSMSDLYPDAMSANLHQLATGGADQVISIDPTPEVMRTLMAHATDNWGGRIILNVDPNLASPTRLLVRAYAQVYGVKVIDKNDKIRGRALTKNDIATLPELRRRIRATEPDAPPHSTAFDLISNAGFRYAAFPFRSRKFCTFVAITFVLAVLFGVAFGFDTEWAIVRWLVTLPFVDFALFWAVVRGVSAGLFLIVLLMIFDPSSRSGRTHKTTPRPHEPYGRHAINNFSEHEPFGSADLAVHAEIAEALTGIVDGLTPKFED